MNPKVITTVIFDMGLKRSFLGNKNTNFEKFPDLMDDQVMNMSQFEEVTPYFMNRDGCMETTATAAPESAMAAGATGLSMPPAPPPPLGGPLGGMGLGGPNPNVIQPGIKSLVHDVQLKRQKEIRDMMKKKREKARLYILGWLTRSIQMHIGLFVSRVLKL